jgi:hypothetical protein
MKIKYAKMVTLSPLNNNKKNKIGKYIKKTLFFCEEYFNEKINRKVIFNTPSQSKYLNE